MDDKRHNLQELIRRALQAQVELGDNELILSARPRPGTRVVSAAEAVGQEAMAPAVDLFGDPVPGGAIPEPQFNSLASHREAVCNCQNCPLGQSRNKFVYGVGNPDADLLFIGEAPGADEDRLGEPFVGRAGQLLDRILAAIQFTRDDVYIANILKCRPPGNRDPQPSEMEACFPYLEEQVALIRPKLICALGRIAGQALLKTSAPLGRLRGDWHEYQGVPTLLTYHPAALLRFPSYKKETWKDMQMLRARYDELTG